MPSSTPHLFYTVTDEHGEAKRHTNVEKALAEAAANAFESGKTTSVLVYPRSKLNLHPARPMHVIYVKVTSHPW